MDKTTYDKFTSTDLLGKHVRTLKEMSNGVAVIPEGQVMTITKKDRGFDLLSEPCPTCEVKLVVTKASYEDVDLVSAAAVVPGETALPG